MYDAAGAIPSSLISCLFLHHGGIGPGNCRCGRASGRIMGVINLQCNTYFYSRIVMDEATRIFSLQQQLGKGQCGIRLRPYQLLYNYNIGTYSTYSMLQ